MNKNSNSSKTKRKTKHTAAENSFLCGFRDGVPIFLGYLSVSFSFGIIAVTSGFPKLMTVIMSLTNLTSAGQFAGEELILAGAPIFEIILTQLVINIRYSLMSLSLTQKLDGSMSTVHRLLCGFFITDEIFAVSSGKGYDIGHNYIYGIGSVSLLGWTLGTLLGAVAGSVLPQSICNALNIALYAMFVAIVIPEAKKSKPVLLVVLISVAISCAFKYIPVLSSVSGGFVIILCAVSASLLGALFFPVKDSEEEAVK